MSEFGYMAHRQKMLHTPVLNHFLPHLKSKVEYSLKTLVGWFNLMMSQLVPDYLFLELRELRSYWIRIIFKQLYLTNRRGPNKYYPSGSERNWEK